MTELKKVLFNTKNFNILIGGNNRTLKDLYNYNHLKPAKIAADTKQMFYTCYESETISNKIMQENFYNIQCIIIFNDFIAGWNGVDFKKADLRTCCKTTYFTKTDLKKHIAASNKNNEIKYICVCCIEYDRTWSDRGGNRRRDGDEPRAYGNDNRRTQYERDAHAQNDQRRVRVADDRLRKRGDSAGEREAQPDGQSFQGRDRRGEHGGQRALPQSG